MANYNYITTDVINIIDKLDDSATVVSSRGVKCILEMLYDCDGNPKAITVHGDKWCGSADINATGAIIFNILLALHASLKLDSYGVLSCECSKNPNTLWYWGNELVAFDKNGDYFIICED